MNAPAIPLTLYVGNKNYSSWSLRAWLALRWSGIPFQEQVIALGAVGYGKSVIPEILTASPSGRVPALHLGARVIHDSMAICEWAAEQAPQLWPTDALARAEARAVSAEMHAGFAALRRDLPMNLRRVMDAPPALHAHVQGDLERIFDMWSALRLRYGEGGPFLFGARTIADAMYAPIATRLRTYAIPHPQTLRAYCETLFADPAMTEWEESARAESWRIAEAEELYT